MSAAVPGTVYLVGAGPGDPGLLTLRAVELLATADVVLHDRLIPLEALDHVRPGAEVIDVGKKGGGTQVPQDVTEDLLVEHARAGRSVVRLKGGDPFVFGRGGEEAQRCVAAGIPFEVVPGVTAGIAAAAYAGIPVTQRRVSAAVAFVTGHADPERPENRIDWAALAAFPGTLVFYMGVRQLARIAEQLVACGRPADQPVAVIQRGTFADQREAHGTLATIAQVAADAGVQAPAVTIVGDVAALAPDLAWLKRGPPARRRQRRRHAGPRAGRRARRAAALARGRGDRGARDPDRAARGGRAAARPVRPDLRDEPQRRRAAAGARA